MENFMNSNRYLIHRGLAYLIDVIFTLTLTALITQINFINPNRDNYQTAYDNFTKYYEANKEDKNITKSDEYKKYTYEIAKYGSSYTYADAVVLLGYFVIFQYFNKGQTLGKKIMKVQLKDKNGNKPKLWQILLRSIIIYAILSDLINATIAITSDQQVYFYVNLITSAVFSILFYTTIIMTCFRPDGKGLHDLVSNTMVIDLNPSKEKSDESIYETKVEEVKISEPVKQKNKRKITKKAKNSKQTKTGE
jgi:uncharacterized RDD family membrane protein YckC